MGTSCPHADHLNARGYPSWRKCAAPAGLRYYISAGTHEGSSELDMFQMLQLILQSTSQCLLPLILLVGESCFSLSHRRPNPTQPYVFLPCYPSTPSCLLVHTCRPGLHHTANELFHIGSTTMNNIHVGCRSSILQKFLITFNLFESHAPPTEGPHDQVRP